MLNTVSRSRIALAGFAAAGALALGACTAPAALEPTNLQPTALAPVAMAPATIEPPAPTAAGATDAAAGAEEGGETYTLAVASGAVGSYLTGEGGKTLYVFKKDTADSGTSACTGSCVDNWPPFTTSPGETVVAGAGATGNIGVITRDDGSLQVTYKGLPLYYYSGDNQAGDTNGEGVGGNWNVAAP